MVRMLRRIGLLSTVMIVTLAATAHASTRFFVNIGAPAPVVVAPVPVAPVVVAPVPPPAPYPPVWQPAYYVWTGYGYRRMPGAWVRPPYAGAAWVPGRWVARPRGSVWVQGYWRR